MSIAVDTNVIVRVLVGDDAAQVETAREALLRGFVLSASVLLETEWVLRSTYGWSRQSIAVSLAAVLDFPTLVEEPNHARWAIERYAAGADFADVIHLTHASSATSFVTFDRRLIRKAGPDAPLPIETLA